MLTRQRLLLALLREAATPVHKTCLVKLAFLLGVESEVREDPTYYRFLPYMYGPFSFSLYQELNALERDGLVVLEDSTYSVPPSRVADVRDVVSDLPLEVNLAVSEVVRANAGLGLNQLLRKVYERYPWYTLNTKIADLCDGKRATRAMAAIAIYTAGYHTESIDAFLDRLLRAGISRIADVRANPVSRKYGFAGSRLRDLCEKVGLKYTPFPRLGIPSSFRQALDAPSDYDVLFKDYADRMLPQATSDIDDLGRACLEEPTALLCAEADPRFCHRKVLAEKVAERTGLEVTHL